MNAQETTSSSLRVAQLPWVPAGALEALPSRGYTEGVKTAYIDREERPRLSVILQYFQMSPNIAHLLKWKSCAGVELLVNVDSTDSADRAWLDHGQSSENVTRLIADAVVFSQNIHEVWRTLLHPVPRSLYVCLLASLANPLSSR